MPHQVLKAAVKGSTGDLAKITAVVKSFDINILAIGGGEGMTVDGEVGVVSMIIEPDEDTSDLERALNDLDLGEGRHLADLEVIPNVHIALVNEVGELSRALEAIGDINIRAIVSLGDFLGESHVALGFAAGDLATAIDRLTDAEIKIIPYDEPPAA
jgi:hypothetical protein